MNEMEANKQERSTGSIANEWQGRKLLKTQAKSVMLLQATGKGVLARRKFASSVR